MIIAIVSQVNETSCKSYKHLHTPQALSVQKSQKYSIAQHSTEIKILYLLLCCIIIFIIIDIY